MPMAARVRDSIESEVGLYDVSLFAEDSDLDSDEDLSVTVNPLLVQRTATAPQDYLVASCRATDAAAHEPIASTSASALAIQSTSFAR